MPSGRRNELDDDEKRSDAASLWRPVADGSSGVRMRRADDPRSPDLISGQYRLLHAIGPSTYGRAFVAEHVPLKRRVAIHFLQHELTTERVLSRELPLAVAKCAQLSHPNVIAVEGYGLSEGPEGLYYVVTEPLEGVSLADHLHASGPLPVKRALSLMRQVGRALRAAHKLGVVHGDLRPGNVRLVDTPGGEVAKVIGFGKTALLYDADLSSHVRVISSPVYTAPELYDGSPIDARSDVYALGAMLYRLIAGEPPYAGRTPMEVMEQHMRAPVPSLRERVGDHISPQLDALVARCLAKRPEDRFPDVVAFMQAMRVLLVEEEDLLSREASGLLSLPPGVNSILPTVEPVPVEPVRASVPPPSANTPWLWLSVAGLVLVGALGVLWWEAQHRQPAKGPAIEERLPVTPRRAP